MNLIANKRSLLISALILLLLPLLLQSMGNFWVRIADFALLYVLLALGLNIVVGFAGLLDLGFVAFFAIGAYMYGLMASPHLAENFAWFAQMFPDGLHTPIWLVIPLGAALAGAAGMILGAPTLKLRNLPLTSIAILLKIDNLPLKLDDRVFKTPLFRTVLQASGSMGRKQR